MGALKIDADLNINNGGARRGVREVLDELERLGNSNALQKADKQAIALRGTCERVTRSLVDMNDQLQNASRLVPTQEFTELNQQIDTMLNSVAQTESTIQQLHSSMGQIVFDSEDTAKHFAEWNTNLFETARAISRANAMFGENNWEAAYANGTYIFKELGADVSTLRDRVGELSEAQQEVINGWDNASLASQFREMGMSAQELTAQVNEENDTYNMMLENHRVTETMLDAETQQLEMQNAQLDEMMAARDAMIENGTSMGIADPEGVEQANNAMRTYIDQAEVAINSVKRFSDSQSQLASNATSATDVVSARISQIEQQMNSLSATDENYYQRLVALSTEYADLVQQSHNQLVNSGMPTEMIDRVRTIRDTAGEINHQVRDTVVNIQNAREELVELLNRQRELESAGRGLGYEEYDANLSRERELLEIIENLVNGLNEYRQRQVANGRATEEVVQKTVTWKDLVNEIKSVWSATTNVIKQVGTAVHNVTGLFAKIGNHIKEMVSNIKLFNSHADHASKPWYKTTWTIAKALIGVRGLYMLVRKLRSAIVAGFQNLAKESIEAQMQLNLLKAKFIQLKNSVAAALAPLAAQIAPVIQRIIDLFTQAFNAVAMFFGALTGKSSVKVAKILDASYGVDDSSSGGKKGETAQEKYDKAVKKAEEKYQKDLAKYNEKVAKAEQKQAEADAKLSDSKEKLNKQLQGFDELNNLTTNDLDDSADAYKDYLADIGEPPELEMPDMEDYLDSSGAGSAAKTMFEDMPIDDFFKDLADKFKDFFSPLLEAWNEVGPRIKQSWHDLVFWMKQLLSDVWNDFLTVWKSDTMVQVWKNILNIIADILDIATVLVQKIREAWNYNDNGLRFLENLAKILETITHWVDTTLRDIKTYIEENISLIPLFDSITENSASLIQVFDALGGILHDFIMEVLMPLGEWVLEDGLPQLIDLFTKLNNDIDWDTLRERLSTLWQKLEPFAEAVGQGLIDFIGEITQKVADFINSEEFGDFLDKLGEWLDSVEPQDITQLAEAITNLLVAIGGFKLLNIGGIVSSIGKLFTTLAGAKLLSGGAGSGGLLSSLFGGGASGAGATGLTAAGVTAGAGMGKSLLGGFVGFLKGAGSTLLVTEGAKALTPALGKFFDKDLGDRLESKYSGFGSLIRFAGDAVSAVKQRMEGGFQNMSLKPFSDKTFDVMWRQNTLRANGNPYEQKGLAELPFYIKNITTSDEALADALSRVQEHGQIYTSDQLKQMEKMGIDVSQVAQAMRETNPEIQEFTNQLVKATGNQELFKVFGADALVYKAALDKMNSGVINSEESFNKYIATMERGTDRTFTMKDAMFGVLASMSDNANLIREQAQSTDELSKASDKYNQKLRDTQAQARLQNEALVNTNTLTDSTTKSLVDMSNITTQSATSMSLAEESARRYADEQARLQMANNNLIGDYTAYNEKLRESSQVVGELDDKISGARRPSPFDEEFVADTENAVNALKEVPTTLDEVNTALNEFSTNAGMSLAESFGTLGETIVEAFSTTFTTKFEEFKTTTTETLTLWVTELQTSLSETFLTQTELLMANIILYLQESYATHLEEFRLLAMQMVMDMTLAMQEQWLIDQFQWDLLIYNIIFTMQNALMIYKPLLITDLLTFCNEILTNVMTALGCSGGGGEGGQEGGGGHSTKFYEIMVQCLQGFIDAVAEKGPEALEVIGGFCEEAAGYFASIGDAALGAVASVQAAMTALANMDMGNLSSLGGGKFSISSGGFNFNVGGFANGTVIPPNAQKFLGVLGDNNRETEVVSPLSTMTQAMTQALMDAGFNNGGNSGDLVVNVDGYELFRIMRNQNDRFKTSTGVSAF